MKYRETKYSPILKRKLNAAFRLMRKRGLIALQNHLCCGSCAGYDIATRVSDLADERGVEYARETVTGCCFYHAQDAERMWSGKEPGVYLAHGPLDTSKHGNIGHSPQEVGLMVVVALEDAGLKYEWDGDVHQRIWVDLDEDHYRDEPPRDRYAEELAERRAGM